MLILFPGALGDFLCLLPALLSYADRSGEPITLVMSPHHSALLDSRHPAFRAGLSVLSIDRPEIGDLFATTPLKSETEALLGRHRLAHSFTGYGDVTFAQRLSRLAESAVTHAFRGMKPGEHASDYYTRCLDVPLTEAGSLRAALAYDRDWLERFTAWHRLPRPRIVVQPGSGSRRKNWSGFPACIEQLRQTERYAVAALLGPAEMERGPEVQAELVVRGATLPQVAALLDDADLYLGNDSGISHLAGAVGCAGFVLFADSDPATWRPRGRLRVMRATQACAACGPDMFCTHRLAQEEVVRAVEASL